MNYHVYGFITCTRTKWEATAEELATEEGVSADEIRQRYSTGWHVDGATGEITYDDDGSGDYSPQSDTIRLEDAIEDHGWIDRGWSSRVLHESRNDVSPVVDASVSVDESDHEDLVDQVLDALGWLEGGYEDNGDGTFYASDSYQPYDEPWSYSYALHFTLKRHSASEGWNEKPWHPEHAGIKV